MIVEKVEAKIDETFKVLIEDNSVEDKKVEKVTVVVE